MSQAAAQSSQLSFRNPAVYCVKGLGQCPSNSPNPQGIAVSDLMGSDGYPDVAACNQADKSVSVFTNNGQGTWGGNPPMNGLTLGFAPISLSNVDGFILEPFDVESAQLDGLGSEDLVVTVNPVGSASGDRPGVLILLSQAGWGFALSNSILIYDTQWTQVNGVAIKDFNADGVNDIAVAGTHNQLSLPKPGLWIFYGPTGGWTLGSTPAITQRIQAGVHFSLAEAAQGTAPDVTPLQFCDKPLLGGDAFMTMDVSGGPSTASKRILQLANSGNFSGQFGVQWTLTTYPLHHSSYRIAAGDFDPGPNTQDWVAYSRERVTPLSPFDIEVGPEGDLFQTDCELEGPFPYPLTESAYSNQNGVAVRPLDFIYADDAVLCYSTGGARGGAAAVFLSTGEITDPLEVNPLYFNTVPAGRTAGCRFVRIADMNKDNRNDMVISNTTDGSISVLINSTPLPEF